MAAWPAHAAIAVVQTVSCSSHAAASCTTGAITTTNGNLFVASSSWMFHSLVSFTSVTDSKSNAYTNAIADTIDTASNEYTIRQDYKAAGSGGASHTFTATLSDAYFVSLSVIEVSGASSTPLDQTATGADGNGTSHSTSSTSTTSQANELLIGNSTAGDNITFTCGGSYTERTNIPADGGVNTSGLLNCSRNVTSASTYAFDFSTSGLARTSSGISTWKEAAAGGTRQRCVGCGTDKKIIGDR